jgi:Clostridial hydrophobic W
MAAIVGRVAASLAFMAALISLTPASAQATSGLRSSPVGDSINRLADADLKFVSKGENTLQSGTLKDLPPAPIRSSEDSGVCLNGHVAGVGWQGWQCQVHGGAWARAGTTGESRALEAVAIDVFGPGNACIASRSRTLGWTDLLCGNDGSGVWATGTTGASLPLEGIAFGSYSHRSCLNTHYQNAGWVYPPGVTACVPAENFRQHDWNGRAIEAIDVALLPNQTPVSAN